MAKFREVQLNRRQALGVAGAAVTPALMVPVMRASAGEPATDEPPTLPKSATANSFDFAGVGPQIIEPAGTITEATGDNFPVLEGNRAAVYFLTMKPGAVREPHWHPDAWELDIPLSGRGRLGVVNTDDTWSTQELRPSSEVGFVPQAYAHYIENVGTDELRWIVVFNNNIPGDIGLSTMFGGMPTHAFTEALGLPEDGLAQAEKPSRTKYIV